MHKENGYAPSGKNSRDVVESSIELSKGVKQRTWEKIIADRPVRVIKWGATRATDSESEDQEGCENS